MKQENKKKQTDSKKQATKKQATTETKKQATKKQTTKQGTTATATKKQTSKKKASKKQETTDFIYPDSKFFNEPLENHTKLLETALKNNDTILLYSVARIIIKSQLKTMLGTQKQAIQGNKDISSDVSNDYIFRLYTSISDINIPLKMYRIENNINPDIKDLLQQTIDSFIQGYNSLEYKQLKRQQATATDRNNYLIHTGYKVINKYIYDEKKSKGTTASKAKKRLKKYPVGIKTLYSNFEMVLTDIEMTVFKYILKNYKLKEIAFLMDKSISTIADIKTSIENKGKIIVENYIKQSKQQKKLETKTEKRITNKDLYKQLKTKLTDIEMEVLQLAINKNDVSTIAKKLHTSKQKITVYLKRIKTIELQTVTEIYNSDRQLKQYTFTDEILGLLPTSETIVIYPTITEIKE